MQSIKYSLLSLLLWAASLSYLAGQSIWRNMSIVGGAALGGQDRRLFYFPPAERLLAREPKKLDYDLAFYLEKRVFRYKNLQMNAGIGYAESNTMFGRPFDHSTLNGGNTLELRYIKKYTINKLIFPVSNKVYVGKLYLQIVVLPAISFKKSAVNNGDVGIRVTKRQLAWNSLEINPGVCIEISHRLQLSVNCRLLYFNEIDKVKFNYLLFDEPYPDFLQQKVDTYNPFKMWLTVGYKLKK